MKNFRRSSVYAAAGLVALFACRRDAVSAPPMYGPDALVFSLRISPDTLRADDQIHVEMRATNPTVLPIQLGLRACAEDLLVLNVVALSGASTPTFSGIPCKAPPTITVHAPVLPAGGTIAKTVQIAAFAVLGSHAPGSYRLRLDYWSDTTRIVGPSQWVEVR